MRDTGLRLVYSVDSRKLDLAAWCEALWNVQVFGNPATLIGPAAVRHAKKIPDGSPTLRFIIDPGGGYDCPIILIFAPRSRIVELFSFAVDHANMTKHFSRGLMKGYGRRKAI
jgi:hypothetical protein